MNFRERPEYGEWRTAVVALFGDKCIACNHAGNIHIHHILPVETYPELAFDPNNGVPLCGNCHAEVSGQEMSYINQLRELQQKALGYSTALAPTIDEIRQSAEADPSNAEAVEAFLDKVTDPQEAVDFYVKHQNIVVKTAEIATVMACHLNQIGKHSECIKFSDDALNLARKEGKDRKLVYRISSWKVQSMLATGHNLEACSYLESLLSEFADNAELHIRFSQTLAKEHTHGEPYSDLCLTHALKAVELIPQDPSYLMWASDVCSMNDRLNEAFDFAKKAFAYARDNEEKINAIDNEAWVYSQNDLYDDAIVAYRRILDIDSQNAGAMADIAHCFYMQDRIKAARDMAKRCLLYDQDNQSAKGTLSYCNPKII